MDSILYLLELPQFWPDENPAKKYIFVFGVILIVAGFIYVNKLKNKGKFDSAAFGGIEFGANAGAGKSIGSVLRRLARSAGLNRDQTRMLEFVFKNDEVTDPAESLRTPELLDRHFKKAYQTITEGAAKPADAQERLALLFSTRNILDNSAITSTRQLAEDTDAVIKAGNESYPSKVLSAKEKNLVVENPLNAGGESVKLPRNSRVTLSFLAQSDKGFSVETQVVGIEESGDGSKLYLAHSTRIQYQSNRKFRRKQTALPADLHLVRLEDTGNKNEKKMVVDKEKLNGKITNISIGGCAIQTSSSIAPGVRLKIEFSPNSTLKAAVLGQELRTNQNGSSTVMHIKFLKVPRRSMNAINALVFEYSDR
ncbi:hypothetical protein FACS189442_5430 [Spirochaetia bacterium]|nr:hypothetical protein FACS189442_5430 [Spirochaetia bacterium]